MISKAGELPAFRDFLDTQQYSQNGILRYEKIFGPGFVSTGGIETTRVRVLATAASLSPKFLGCAVHAAVPLCNRTLPTAGPG